MERSCKSCARRVRVSLEAVGGRRGGWSGFWTNDILFVDVSGFIVRLKRVLMERGGEYDDGVNYCALVI